MSDATAARWYVVQTQVNGEAKAAQNLCAARVTRSICCDI